VFFLSGASPKPSLNELNQHPAAAGFFIALPAQGELFPCAQPINFSINGAAVPKNKVTDPITDQEITFARLVLSGTMTDRQAAEAAGLNPNTAAYTKSKPRVRAYLLEHSTAVRQQLVEQDADLSRRAVDQQNRLTQTRDRVLARLWELASLAPEMTRGSMSGQVKALSLIAAIEGLIPGRRPASAQNKPAPPPVTADIYPAAWLRKQQENGVSPPPPAQQEAAPEPPKLSSRLPRRAVEPERSVAEGPAVPPNPTADLARSTDSAGRLSPSQTTSPVPRVPMADYSAPDTRAPFFIRKNPWARRR
jgi:hypothetical protein